jgi:hypothetical protein
VSLSKIKEYLKLLPQALKNPEDVINGWVNDAKFEKGTLDEPFMDEIIRRRAICNECPMNSKFHPPTEREDEFCTCCGCPIAKKTACFECNCGIQEHNEKFPEDRQELKWTYFKIPTNENQD